MILGIIQYRLDNAVKSKDVDRFNVMQTCQRAKLLTTSNRNELQNELTESY